MLIGIDLGTTNSLAACFRDGKVEMIPNRMGRFLTPSVVAVDEKGQILIGDTAKEYGYLHPEACARLFKRTMGTDKTYSLGDLSFSSEELSAMVLRSLKEDAQVYLGQEADEAIISVPAYFNDAQRKATKQAGELAGLKVSRIINEPTASAIAYGVGENEDSECCMVLDLGGGTFDVTILEYFQNIMEVYAVAGDNCLGGEDFTAVLAKMFIEKAGLDTDKLSLKALSDIYKEAERVKCTLQDGQTMAVRIGRKVHKLQLDAKEYEDACLTLLEKIRKPIEKALRDAKITLNDLDRIILVGGAMRLNLVKDHIRSLTGIYPDLSLDPDLSIAKGAALVCAMKERDRQIEEVILTDVCPFTLGTEVVSDDSSIMNEYQYLPIIERNTVIPVSRTQRVFTAQDDQTSVLIKVLQGESRIPSANLLIGSIDIEVPKGPKGQEAIEITYTYDVDALLEVKAKVVSTGKERTIIIQNEKNGLSEEEARKRLERLQYLKQNPRDDEENIYALAKARRIYEEVSGADRTLLEKQLAAFEEALNKGTRLEIASRRQELLETAGQLESGSSSYLS